MSQPRKLLPVANPKCVTLDWTKLSDHPPKSWSQWLQNDFEAGVRALHLPIHSALELAAKFRCRLCTNDRDRIGSLWCFCPRIAGHSRRQRAALEQGWASRAIRDECLPLSLRRPYFGAFQQITAPSIAKSRLGNHAASNSQFSREINASGDSETDAA